jgi:hypothetical protein
MSNDDLEKQLGQAMDGEPTPGAPVDAAFEEPTPSTSKKTLKGAMVAKPVERIAKPVERSAEEAYLQGKLDALTELMAAERGVKVKVANAKAAVEADETPEETVKFRVNLPPEAANLRIDGREYYHGFTYEIPYRQAKSMQDNQARAWQHHEQVAGHRQHAAGVSTSGIHISGQGQVLTNPTAF